MLKESNSPQLITEMLKETKDSNGHSLFDHLSLFLSQIEPSNKDSFEFLSDFFKKHRFNPTNLKSAEEVKRLESFIREENEWKVKASTLLTDVKTLKKQPYLYRPLMETTGMLEWAGISFGKKEAYLLDNSIKKLASAVDAKQLRFWGKILAKKQDYYVVQGISSKKNKTEVKGNMEKAGVGANQFTYWVTHNYLNQWYELPLVTPQQIQTSRLINYIFTGDLNAQIKSYPPFPGQEKHLLKAQLVRITHSCQITPKGLLSASTVQGTEEDLIEFAEDFAYPEFGQLKNLQNWVHSNKVILSQGRTTYYEDPSLTQQQRAAKLAQFEGSNEKKERLAPISEDKPLREEEGASNWFMRTYGDTQVFKGPSDEQNAPQSTYAVIAIRSLLWPGWATVSDKQYFSSIYVGYGLKEGQTILSPMAPSNLGAEGQDIDEYPQPNPKEPLDELEPDSDQEHKKQEDA